MDTVRESALKVDWEKNPLLHQGIGPVSVVCQSDALLTELQSHLFLPSTEDDCGICVVVGICCCFRCCLNESRTDCYLLVLPSFVCYVYLYLNTSETRSDQNDHNLKPVC